MVGAGVDHRGQQEEEQGVAESGDMNFSSARDSMQRGERWSWRYLGQPRASRSAACEPASPEKILWGQAGLRARLNVSTSVDVALGNFEGHSESLGRQFHAISESLQ